MKKIYLLMVFILLGTIFVGSCSASDILPPGGSQIPTSTISPVTTDKAYPVKPSTAVSKITVIPTQAYPAVPTSKPSIPPSMDQNPKPTDGRIRGPVFIDRMELTQSAAGPGKFQLNIAGNRPTPCHELQYMVNPPDKDNRIVVDLFTIAKVGQMCTQVLSPFSVAIDLSSIPSGIYAVFVNENKVGEIRVNK